MSEEIKDMIEPIPNWEFTYRYDGSRTFGKSYTQNLLKEKDKEIEQLRTELNTKDNIINYIRQVFENGSFEDGCDCIKIYDYLKQLKEDK